MISIEIVKFREKFLADAAVKAAISTRSGMKVFANPAALNNNEFEKAKASVRKTISSWLIQYGYIIKTGKPEINERNHIRNIRDLCETITDMHSNCLHDSKFRLGISQKAINLYLKFLWVFNLLGDNSPPHCPFDSRIVDKIKGGCAVVSWTKLDNEKEYKNYLSLAFQASGGVSLSQWELKLFNQL